MSHLRRSGSNGRWIGAFRQDTSDAKPLQGCFLRSVLDLFCFRWATSGSTFPSTGPFGMCLGRRAFRFCTTSPKPRGEDLVDRLRVLVVFHWYANVSTNHRVFRGAMFLRGGVFLTGTKRVLARVFVRRCSEVDASFELWRRTSLRRHGAFRGYRFVCGGEFLVGSIGTLDREGHHKTKSPRSSVVLPCPNSANSRVCLHKTNAPVVWGFHWTSSVLRGRAFSLRGCLQQAPDKTERRCFGALWLEEGSLLRGKARAMG